jgi:hypothetical protein
MHAPVRFIPLHEDMLFRAWSLDGTRIDARPLVDAIPPMEVGLLWRRSGDMAPAARQLHELLIQAHGAWPGGSAREKPPHACAVPQLANASARFARIRCNKPISTSRS